MPTLTQEQLLKIFNAVKKEMKPYEKGYVKARFDIQGRYELWTEKPKITIQGRLRNELAFIGLILQSSYVGFYYTPIYTNSEDVSSRLSTDLLKLLKGKACFHIKAVDKNILTDIKQAMKVGYEEYSNNGWL